MKVKSLVISAATAVIVPVAGFAVPALASSPGQIGDGDIYKIKNMTENSKYSSSATAKACQELQYSVTLHNPGYGTINNVLVKASLPAGASKTNASDVTISYSDGIGSPVKASASVTLDSAQSISYESGTTRLFDGNGNVVKTLSDGITNGGVNIGSLPGSTTEYVNFKAKINCPTPPTCKTNCTPKPPVTPPTTPSTPVTPTTPTTLVNTGPGDVAAAFAAATMAGAIGYRVYLSRRLARQ